MGITGLLGLLKSIQRPCKLTKFAGQTIGVDAYGWLHKGAVACAVDLALGRHTTKFVEYAMYRVRMLQHFGITPFLVFDGDYLPSKAVTETYRATKREESKRLGLALIQQGKPAQAYQELQKAIDITPEMASQLIEELRRVGIKFIVAPYEADSQLVYLERKGVISGIISEDSDLLVFGANCLITKLDQYGDCILIDRADFTACTDISLVGWSDAEFRRMAILSGCDYLPSIYKMGLKTAYRLVRKYKTADRIIQALQFEGQFRVPAGYLESFKQAELAFMHQRVFCPMSNELVMFTEPEEKIEEEELSYLGRRIEPVLAVGVANGELHPMTKEPLPRYMSRRINPLGFGRANPASTDLDSLKRGKSIQEFFKAKRTPLAELDPNSFTPSPSQRRLLHQHSNTSWTTRSAPSRTQTSSSANDLQTPTNDRHTGRLEDTLPSLSSTRPSKRPRLCADEDVRSTATPGEKSKSVQSKFFAKTGSPTKKQRGKNRKSKINIFSDDSVEEAMSRLPDDWVPLESAPPEDFDVILDWRAHPCCGPNAPPIYDTSETPSAIKPAEKDATELSDESISTSAPDIRPFTGPPPGEIRGNDSAQVSGVSSAGKAAPSPSAREVLSNKSKNTDASAKRSTPLQRIGAKALLKSYNASKEPLASRDAVRSMTECSPPSSAGQAPPSPSTQRVSSKKSKKAATSAKGSSLPRGLETKVLKSNNASNLPAVSRNGVRSSIEQETESVSGIDGSKGSFKETITKDSEVTNQWIVMPAGKIEGLRGSEDLIIPDSEEEGDILSPVGFGVEEAFRLR